MGGRCWGLLLLGFRCGSLSLGSQTLAAKALKGYLSDGSSWKPLTPTPAPANTWPEKTAPQDLPGVPMRKMHGSSWSAAGTPHGADSSHHGANSLCRTEMCAHVPPQQWEHAPEGQGLTYPPQLCCPPALPLTVCSQLPPPLASWHVLTSKPPPTNEHNLWHPTALHSHMGSPDLSGPQCPLL